MERFGGPEFCGSGFDVQAPNLPSQSVGDQHFQSTQNEWTKTQTRISLVSANVATLGVGVHGFPGKLAFIKSQFLSFHLNFAGFQETRTAEGSVCADGILRLCSGSQKSSLGVELWCNLRQPYLWCGQEAHYFVPGDFQVLLRDPAQIADSY